MYRGAIGGGGFFYTLAKRRNTFYTFTKAMFYIIIPITNIPAPPSKNYPVAPLLIITLLFQMYCVKSHFLLADLETKILLS